MKFASADIDLVFESARVSLFERMNRASILRSAGAVTEADRVTDRVVRELGRLVADLEDRHHTRVQELTEIKQRSELAARNRPTLHSLTRKASQPAPSAATAPPPAASPDPHGASS